MNPNYILQEEGAIINWFEITAPDGRLSLNNTIGAIMETLRGKLLIIKFALKINKMRKKAASKSKDESSPANALKINGDMIQIIKSFTIPRLSGMIGMIGINLQKEDLLKLNKKLNKIKIKKNK